MAFDIRDLNVYISRAMIFVLIGAAAMMPVLMVFGSQFNGDTQRAAAERALAAAAAKQDRVDVQIVGPDETDVIIDPKATPTLRPQPTTAVSPSPAATSPAPARSPR